MSNQSTPNDSDYGHWVLSSNISEFNPDDWIGFIYEIHNTLTGMKYIGQKVFHNKVTKPPLKGNKNKRRSTKPSNWKDYTGSSNRLNEDIHRGNVSDFTFTIMDLCNCKWDLNYKEIKAIVLSDAVPNVMYYNEFIGGKCGKCPKSSYIS